jgi:hypothetical protein
VNKKGLPFDIEIADREELEAKKQEFLRLLMIIENQLGDPIREVDMGAEYRSWKMGAILRKKKIENIVGRINAQIKNINITTHTRSGPPVGKLEKEVRRYEHEKRMKVVQEKFNLDPEDPNSLLQAVWMLLDSNQVAGRLTLNSEEKILTYHVRDYLQRYTDVGKGGIIRSKKR